MNNGIGIGRWREQAQVHIGKAWGEGGGRKTRSCTGCLWLACVDRDIHVFIRLRDRMLSVGSEAVKAKVIALYAVVLSNANHRRQNVRRGEANRVCGLTAPLLNPISLLPVSLPSSRFIPPLLYTSDPPLRNVLAQLPFPISRSAGKFFSTSPANTIKNTIYKPINHPVESRFRVENCYSRFRPAILCIFENVRRVEKISSDFASLFVFRAGARYGVVLRFQRGRGGTTIT